MTDKRFERVYGDVEVVCIDHQKYGEDKFISYDEYDKFVELLNELHEENTYLKMNNCRMVKFLLSEGYTLKDYLKFIEEDKE